MTTNIPEDPERRHRWFKKLIDPKKRCMNLRSYVKKLFNRKLEKNQYFVLRDMLDPKIRNIYYCTARQAGKTEVIAIFQALTALFPDCVIPFYEGNGHCYVFAPKQEQAQLSFERFSKLIHYNDYEIYPPEEFLVDKSDRVTFKNGFEARAITASRNSEIEGLTTHVIILDESQHISPFKVRECLTGDTIIPLANGEYTTLKQIVDNKLKVLTPTGEEMPIKHFEYDEDVIYEITLSNGKVLKCNANHNHLVYHKNWRDNKSGATKKLNTLELKEGHRLSMADSLPYFGQEGSYEDGIIIGSFLGDGSICGDYPVFCGNRAYVNCLDSIIAKEYNISFKTKVESDKLIEGRFTGDSNKKRANGLKNFFTDLEMWGMKGIYKEVPNKQWSKEFLKGLVVGLIETDGCVRESTKRNGFICFDNISERMVKQLQNYLQKFGIHTRVSVKENNGGWGYKQRPIWTLTIKSVEDIIRFYNTFTLITKQDKLEELYNQRKNHKGRNTSKHYPSNMRFSRIVGIKKLDKKEKVYCVQIGGKHQWIVDGIISFNSIFPMGGGVPGGAKIIQCGLPGMLGSHFHTAFKNEYDPDENPYGYVHHIYPWKECPRVLRNMPYVMALKAQDDEAFERNYELNWSRSNMGYFINEEQYVACEKDYDPAEKRKEALEKGWELHWGIDFAKLRDSTVLTEMALDPETEEFYLVRLFELKGVDYIVQIAMFSEMYNPAEVVHIAVDQSSIGEVNVELMQSKSMSVHGEVFSIQKKELIYKNYKHYIERQMVHWPNGKSIESKEFKKILKRFQKQMMELETEHRLTGHTSYHCNENDNLARDDFPDSSALAIWSATQYVPPNVGYE